MEQNINFVKQPDNFDVPVLNHNYDEQFADYHLYDQINHKEFFGFKEMSTLSDLTWINGVI